MMLYTAEWHSQVLPMLMSDRDPLVSGSDISMYTLYWWVYQHLSLHQLCRASLHMNWQLCTEWDDQVFWLTHPFVTGRAVCWDTVSSIRDN